jgi:[acyl-carrier-protein] S-malonyltransferase
VRARKCSSRPGPGKVLTGLMRQIDPAQKTLNVEDTASLEKTLAELNVAG